MMKMKVRNIIFVLITVYVMFAMNVAFAAKKNNSLDVKLLNEYRVTPTTVKFNIPNLETASVNDSHFSTGATLFFFPSGARTNFDVRGGSVAAIETTLLEEGSYSNVIDGIVFSGGSTLGLAATDGVRAHLFEERKNAAQLFNAIPSIPGAVVYDFGGRVAPYNDKFIYPDYSMGRELARNKKAGEFQIGRVGAGVNTSFNKIGSKRWGGQGFAQKSKGDIQVLAFVVLNAMGDVKNTNGQTITAELKPIKKPVSLLEEEKPTSFAYKTNTTLSLIVTNAKLDRSQLKRLAVMTHTSMAAQIRPFHTSSDGDIQFTTSVGELAVDEDAYYDLSMLAAEAMSEAIYNGIRASNAAAFSK
jgi:L-aminopeptidase/D-esterase-like protein